MTLSLLPPVSYPRVHDKVWPDLCARLTEAAGRDIYLAASTVLHDSSGPPGVGYRWPFPFRQRTNGEQGFAFAYTRHWFFRYVRPAAVLPQVEGKCPNVRRALRLVVNVSRATTQPFWASRL